MTTARKLIALLGVSAGVYALTVRPRILRWGTSDEEVRGSYPGADLIPGGRRGATMAVTIAAAQQHRCYGSDSSSNASCDGCDP